LSQGGFWEFFFTFSSETKVKKCSPTRNFGPKGRADANNLVPYLSQRALTCWRNFLQRVSAVVRVADEAKNQRRPIACENLTRQQEQSVLETHVKLTGFSKVLKNNRE
jgi:hypothetical protein